MVVSTSITVADAFSRRRIRLLFSILDGSFNIKYQKDKPHSGLMNRVRDEKCIGTMFPAILILFFPSTLNSQ
jgi:hypothetical protein